MRWDIVDEEPEVICFSSELGCKMFGAFLVEFDIVFVTHVKFFLIYALSIMIMTGAGEVVAFTMLEIQALFCLTDIRYLRRRSVSQLVMLGVQIISLK
jgi:hypothetical protein